MPSDTTQKAIDAALTRDWKTAIDLNLQILKQNPKDLDALNRLGRAYLETGQKTKSSETYSKVLKIDKFNSIAIKSLDLLKTSRVQHSHNHTPSAPPPMFLEEPGITKTVSLTRLGDPKITSCLHPGDALTIVAREHIVAVVSTDSQNIGRLPDDLASKMRLFLKAGNKYNAWVKSVDQQCIKIFIKELSRSSKYRNTPSFPITEKLSYAAFTPPELIHDEKPDTSAPEEQDDGRFRPEPELDSNIPEPPPDDND